VSSSSFAGGVGAPIVSDYVARRGGSGWVTENVSQPSASDSGGAQLSVRFGYRWFSSDLTRGLFMRSDSLDLDRNLWLRDFAAGSNERLSPASITPLDPFAQFFSETVVADATDDAEHVVFESMGQLTADAPPADGGARAYEWADGEIRLVGVLPASEGGGPAPTSLAGRGATGAAPQGPGTGGPGANAWSERVMSEDGSRIYFTVPTGPQGSGDSKSAPGEVYLREDGATTTHVSASQRTDCAGDPTCGGDGVADPVSDPDGPGQVRFETASSDGSVVYLQSCRKLTDDSTGNCGLPYREELFRYDVASGELTNLTPQSALALGMCTSQCGVIGASKDGEYVYLADVEQPGVGGTTQTAYVWHGGTITEVGPAYTARRLNVTPYIEGPRTSRVSDDGRFLVWLNQVGDTDDDRLYIYDAQEDQSVCLSCRPGPDAAPSSASPGARGQNPALTSRDYHSRAFDSAGERVFFNTTAGLVPEDTNGRWDVYVHDIATGEKTLLSDGSRNGDAYLGDMTPDGSSVFIVTDQGLVRGDDDGLRDLYVARVNGGYPEPASDRGSCTGDACQDATAAPPPVATAGSVVFAGAGNLSDRKPSGSVSVARLRAVIGSAATLRVKVPAAGGITVLGASVRKARRSASKGATYSVRVALTAKARRALKSKRALKVRVRVSFTPRSGGAVSKTVTLTF
jgi:Tol biopolymer transport system component